MSLPQRHARRLRLVAGSQEAARAAVPRLEDALRCASLPDAGSRLLVVRRLALGRLPRQASSQAIARLIEARFAEGGARWTEGETDDRTGAECVVFASAWHARVALAARLLRGERVSAWYWPLAVPEFRCSIAVGDNLRAIAGTLALSPEARVALPAWAVRVVRAGGAARLAALLPERFGEALLREAGLPLPFVAQGRAIEGVGKSTAPASSAIGAAHADPRRRAAPPPWLQSLLQAGGWGDVATVRASPGARRALPRAAASTSQPCAGSAREALAPRPRLPEDARAAPAVEASRHADVPVAGDASARPGLRIDAAIEAPGQDAEGADTRDLGDCGTDKLPTAFAGLPFLLPVLAHLGLPRWAEAEAGGGDPADWARAVLAAALARLRAPQDDPVWAIALPEAPWPPRLADGRRCEECIDDWLGTARRWLRREARIGLASLVRRPGRLGLTPTHLDMHFALSTVDLRVRRLGLDIDPGWLPWFGRVIAFHYEDEAP